MVLPIWADLNYGHALKREREKKLYIFLYYLNVFPWFNAVQVTAGRKQIDTQINDEWKTRGIDTVKEAPYSFLKVENTRFRSKILYIGILLEEWN